MNPSSLELIGTVLFALAVLHTFSVGYFQRLAHRHPTHAGTLHLLGEVEAVFGFWAMVLMIFMILLAGKSEATHYLDTRNFTEPMFVFAIMVIAASRPILQLAQASVSGLAHALPLPTGSGYFFVTLSLVPLLGSFITEPAAMTLAAFILRDRYFCREISTRLKYAAIGVLFVNISIGGTLTPYAAPPVLMVAGKWGWDLMFMLQTFGWKSAVAVIANAAMLTAVFHRELARLKPDAASTREPASPSVIFIHLGFLVGVVVFAHTPAAFMGLLLFFIGFTQAYQRHQDRLILREGLMVALFLAGLIVLGGQQKWWLQSLLTGMDHLTLYFGATALTAITDNAALTYLGSLVENVDANFQYYLVAGAVTGGGLTVIANAPNPAGSAILSPFFKNEVIHPGGLFVAALPPTVTAILAFLLL